MKKTIILRLDRVYIKEHPNNEMHYESENIVLNQIQKQKIMNLIFNKKEKWTSLLSDKEDIQKEAKIALRKLEPFEVNINIMQWFARSKEEENQNNQHLWSASITIKAPLEMIRKFEEPLLKNPTMIALIGQDDEEEEIQFNSEFMNIDAIKNLLKELEPELEIEYDESHTEKKRKNEQRIRNIIEWNDEDFEFYKDFFNELVPGVTIEKMKELRNFVATIEGNLDEKLKAVKKKFPEHF
jgi:hypothetical protein